MLFALALLACTTETEPLPPIVADVPPPVATTPAKIPAILLADTEPLPAPTGSVTVRDCSTTRTEPLPTPKPRPTMQTTTTKPPSKAVAANDLAPSAPPTAGVAPDGAAPPPMTVPVVAEAAEPVAAAAAPRPDPASVSGGTLDNRGSTGEKMETGSARADKPTVAPRPKEVESKKAEAAPMDAIAEGDASDQGGASGPPRTTLDLARAVPQPYYDWGGVTWLSNDDSMSLASAQHVLHAVDHGTDLSPSQIRPHELLNYFSFDTVVPAEGALFSATASAEKTDASTLTVAIAVKGAVPPRRPMDLTLIVDRSGSMKAEGRMEYVKRGLALMTESLVVGDRVDLVLFDNAVCTPVENYVVGRDDPSILSGAIAKMAPAGGTNIGIGLKAGYDLVMDPTRDAGIHRNRRVMLMTDALTNQGEIDAEALGKVAEGFEKHGVRLTGVGVGVGFNDAILDTVTDRGHGGYVYLGSEGVVDRLFGPGFRSMVETIAHDVQFELDLPPSLAMAKFYGEESSTVKAEVQPIDYYSGTAQLFLQDLRVDPAKLGPDDVLKMTIHYRDAYTDEPGTQEFAMNVAELIAADHHNLDKGRALIAWTDLLLAKAMGGDPCGAPLSTWTERAGKVSDDAEIVYVHGLVGNTCRATSPLPEASVTLSSSVAYKIRVDADVPIAEVALACGGHRATSRLSGGDNVARFDARPGSCTVTLQGNVPMVAKVDVPSVGGDVKCLVRGGRVSCG